MLDQGGSAFEADHWHWAEFLAKRKRFIERILERSERHPVIAALRESLDRLAYITPDLCDRYLHAWARDRDLWLHHIAALPTGQTRQQALGLLSAPGAPSHTSYLGSRITCGSTRPSDNRWHLEHRTGWAAALADLIAPCRRSACGLQC